MTGELTGQDRRTLFLVIFSIFATAWVLLKEPMEIYVGYVAILVLLPIYIFRFGIPSGFWIAFSYLSVTGLINIALGNDTIDQFLKIFIGMMISYLFYYLVYARFNFDVHLLFKVYLKGAYIVALIGLIQLISYLIGFTPGYDFRWLGIFNKWGVISGGNLGIRINSIFGEPSTFAAVIAPAMFVSLNNIFSPANRYGLTLFQSLVILVVYLTTFSSLGYIGLFVALVLLMINYGFARFLFLFVPVLIAAYFYLYNNVEDFRYRWDSTFFIFSTGQIDVHTEHGSSIVFYNNYVVAIENFERNFLTGTGLGSHPVAFDKYSVTKDIATYGFANNSADANSMLLRIISELGVIGLVIAGVFLKRGYVRRSGTDSEDKFWLLSSASLCIIILYLIRQGHYFINGFPFFVWLYYYARQNADRNVTALQENRDTLNDTGSNSIQ